MQDYSCGANCQWVYWMNTSTSLPLARIQYWRLTPCRMSKKIRRGQRFLAKAGFFEGRPGMFKRPPKSFPWIWPSINLPTWSCNLVFLSCCISKSKSKIPICCPICCGLACHVEPCPWSGYPKVNFIGSSEGYSVVLDNPKLRLVLCNCCRTRNHLLNPRRFEIQKLHSHFDPMGVQVTMGNQNKYLFTEFRTIGPKKALAPCPRNLFSLLSSQPSWKYQLGKVNIIEGYKW